MRKHVFATVAVPAIALAAATTADAATIEGPLTVTVSNDAGTATFAAPIDEMTKLGETSVWQLGKDVALLDAESGKQIAMIGRESSIEITNNVLEGAPNQILTLSFDVTAGNSATDFLVSAPTLNFPGIDNPLARAAAGYSLVDNDGDGASVTGDFAGDTQSYEASYNGGTLFTYLLDNAAAGAFNSTAMADEFLPGGAFSPIAGTVTSMDAAFDFNLSANDSFVGNSVFTVVIPEPGSLALLGLGGLVVAGSRRIR